MPITTQAKKAMRRDAKRQVSNLRRKRSMKEAVKMVRDLGIEADVLHNVELYNLLSKAGAVVVHSSTIGIEAILLGTPVVFFEEKAGPESLFDSIDCVLKARSLEGLSKALAIALGKEGGKDALKKRMASFAESVDYKRDGKASLRIISLVKEMAGTMKKSCF